MIKKKKEHKRHFQLLELMVAAFILLVCIAPAMRIFTTIYQAQQEVTRENLRDHLAHMVHAKFVELLYKRQISLEEVLKNQPISLSDPELDEQLKKGQYRCEGTFTVVDSFKPKGQEKPTMYLAKLVINLVDVEHKNKKSESPSKSPSDREEDQEGTYDYFIYIDSGDLDKNPKGKTREPRDPKQLTEPSDQTALSQPPSSAEKRKRIP